VSGPELALDDHSGDLDALAMQPGRAQQPPEADREAEQRDGHPQQHQRADDIHAITSAAAGPGVNRWQLSPPRPESEIRRTRPPCPAR
jgi:hypothetical protein